MDVITAVSNPHVKALRALYTKKGREEAGLYPVEGVNIVKDIPPEQRVQAYYIAASRAEELMGLVKDPAASVYVLADDLMRRVAETVTPSGIVAVLPIPASDDSWRVADKVLVMDGVSDPGNVGTMMRTAIAADYRHVVMLGGVDPYNPKVVRASMGGIYRLSVHCLTAVDFDTDTTVLLLDMAGDNVFDVRPMGRYALVVGSEASGASDAMRARADRVVSIPMTGGIESLNAAVAAAVGMYVINANSSGADVPQ